MIKKYRINLFILIILFSIFILIIPNIYAINILIDNESYDMKKVDDIQILGFQIDQYQNNEGGFNMILGYFNIAQSFKPNLTPLVKVDLFGYSIDDGNSLKVSIKEYANMDDLTSVVISSEEIPDQLSWFECNFPDIEVQLDKTYYLVINQIGDGKFIWYGNYQHDFYPRGYAYSNQENTQTWVNLSEIFQDLDFCFKTYSYGENQPPNLPSINGSISGKIGETYDYDFNSIDPENDRVLYRIDWGSGINSQWFGPYNSGESITFSHKWEEKGDYLIKVQSKDIYGDKSEWSTLEISMVKNKLSNNNLQNYNFIRLVTNFLLFLKDIY